MNMEKTENKHNPRIVIAMDSFKGCLSSIEAGLAVKAGLERTLPDTYAEVFRISDGGEGLVDALAGSIGGEPIEKAVTGPMGETVTAMYCFSREKRLAVIEMASAGRLSSNRRGKN